MAPITDINVDALLQDIRDMRARKKNTIVCFTDSERLRQLDYQIIKKLDAIHRAYTDFKITSGDFLDVYIHYRLIKLDYKAESAMVYSDYVMHSESAMEIPVARCMFTQRLALRGIYTKRSNGTIYYVGVSIRFTPKQCRAHPSLPSDLSMLALPEPLATSSSIVPYSPTRCHEIDDDHTSDNAIDDADISVYSASKEHIKQKPTGFPPHFIAYFNELFDVDIS